MPPRRLHHTQPYLLVATDDRLRYVLKLYDGAPSDEAIKAAIVASVEGSTSASLPFAAYDVESDAVSLLAKTASGVNAQLFGPTPNGARTAIILYADGHYFTAGRSGEILMREAGVACPSKLGELGERRLIVLYGAAGALDLGCQYSSDGASVTVFVMRAPGLTVEKAFQARKSSALKRHGAQATALLVDVKGDQVRIRRFVVGRERSRRRRLGGATGRLCRRGRRDLEAGVIP